MVLWLYVHVFVSDLNKNVSVLQINVDSTKYFLWLCLVVVCTCTDVCGVFASVYPAQVLQTSISSSCWVFARYIFHVLVLVVYHQYLYQVYNLESDR